MKVCAKLRTKVTNTNLGYEGSITLSREMLDKSGLLPSEEVDVFNISNGEQFTTYVIEKDVEQELLSMLKSLAAEILAKWYGSSLQPVLDKGVSKIRRVYEEGCCINGAAARKVQIGDVVEVLSLTEKRPQNRGQ